MRARRIVILSALLLLVGAVGCGGDDGGGGEGAGETTTTAGGSTTSEAATVDLSGQTIEVAAVWSGAEQQAFTQVLDAFEAKTGAQVTFTSTGDDIAAVLGPRISGGSPPDVGVLPQPGLLRDFVEQGQLRDLTDVAGDEVDENYDEVWRELGSVDGKLYGVWYKAANKSTVWYNRAVFADAGVEPPADWEAFLEMARTISDFGVTPVSIGGADGWVLTDWFENVYLRTAGPEKYDQLSRHEIPWTDQSVKEALGVLAELFSDQALLAGGSQGALQADFPSSVQKVFAEPPAAAIVYEGDFVAAEVTELGRTVGTDADFFPFPSVEGSEPGVVGGGDVAVLFKDTPGGKELVRWLATPEAAEVWARQGGYLSPNQNVDEQRYPDDVTRRLAEQLVEAETFRFDLSDLQPAAFGGTVGAGMWKLLQDFMANPTGIDAITTQLEAGAVAAWGR